MTARVAYRDTAVHLPPHSARIPHGILTPCLKPRPTRPQSCWLWFQSQIQTWPQREKGVSSLLSRCCLEGHRKGRGDLQPWRAITTVIYRTPLKGKSGAVYGRIGLGKQTASWGTREPLPEERRHSHEDGWHTYWSQGGWCWWWWSRSVSPLGGRSAGHWWAVPHIPHLASGLWWCMNSSGQEW